MISIDSQFKIYKHRWFMLFLFCLSNFSNGLLWVTFASISDLTEVYIGCSTSAVNILTTLFLIMYIPGTILASYIHKNYGLRENLLAASFLTGFGAFFRLIPTLFNRDSINGDAIYALFFIGQVLGATAQPIFTNIPTIVSSVWFPSSERDIATSFGSMSQPLGDAIGQIFPSVFVSMNSANEVTGMTQLMGLETAICLGSFILCALFFSTGPPTPPSASAASRQEMASHIASQSFVKLMKKNVGTLFMNVNYVILFLLFSLVVGLFNAVMTLIFQYVSPYGYSNADSGYFAAILIVAGILGSSVAGVLMRVTKAYRTLLKITSVLYTLSIVFMIFMLKPNNFGLLLFSFAVLGFFALPLLPIAMENSAECVYPISEDVSVGILFIGANIIGIPFIFIMQALIDYNASVNVVFDAASSFVFVISALAFIVAMFYNGEYRRTSLEIAHAESNQNLPQQIISNNFPNPSDADSIRAADSMKVGLIDNDHSSSRT